MANYVFIIISYDTSRAFALYTRFAVCLKWCFCSVSLTNNWIYSWDLWGRFIRTRTLLKCAIMEIWRWKGPCTSCFHVSSEAQTHARTRTHTHTDSYTHMHILNTRTCTHSHAQTNKSDVLQVQLTQVITSVSQSYYSQGSHDASEASDDVMPDIVSCVPLGTPNPPRLGAAVSPYPK